MAEKLALVPISLLLVRREARGKTNKNLLCARSALALENDESLTKNIEKLESRRI